MCIIPYETSLYQRFNSHANSPGLACSLFWRSDVLSTVWICPKIVDAERPALAVSSLPQEVPVGHGYLGGTVDGIVDGDVRTAALVRTGIDGSRDC